MFFSNTKKTNLFIVGFPKCGTTAIYQYLSEHKNVHLCFPKEPHYFIESDWHRHPAKTEKQYLNLFSGASEEAEVFLDSSALHIYSEQALRRMYAFNPDAKIVLMIRNPKKMVVSYHKYEYRTFIEDEGDFEKAWALQDSRKEGRTLPSSCKYPIRLQYKNIGLMGKHVKTLLDIWPRDQVEFVILDEFIADPLGQYKEMLSFIGIPYDGRTEFPPVNEGGGWKSKTVGRLMMFAWPILIKTVITLRLSSLLRKPKFLLFLWKMSSAKEEKTSIPDNMAPVLNEAFNNDIKRLSSLLNKNLDHWL